MPTVKLCRRSKASNGTYHDQAILPQGLLHLMLNVGGIRGCIPICPRPELNQNGNSKMTMQKPTYTIHKKETLGVALAHKFYWGGGGQRFLDIDVRF